MNQFKRAKERLIEQGKNVEKITDLKTAGVAEEEEEKEAEKKEEIPENITEVNIENNIEENVIEKEEKKQAEYQSKSEITNRIDEVKTLPELEENKDNSVAESEKETSIIENAKTNNVANEKEIEITNEILQQTSVLNKGNEITIEHSINKENQEISLRTEINDDFQTNYKGEQIPNQSSENISAKTIEKKLNEINANHIQTLEQNIPETIKPKEEIQSTTYLETTDQVIPVVEVQKSQVEKVKEYKQIIQEPIQPNTIQQQELRQQVYVNPLNGYNQQFTQIPPQYQEAIQQQIIASQYINQQPQPHQTTKKSIPNIFSPKEEAKSMRKSLVLKPTSVKKAENYCNKNGGSFNELIQTLLDNFIEEYGL